jgi:hypothetical protein
VARAKAAAAGDGAITLMMAERQSKQGLAAHENGRYLSTYRVGTLDVEVDLVPVSQLVNVNNADARLLALLFTELAAVDAGEAQSLAGGVIQWRQSISRYQRMDAPEDLMAAGVPRTILDAMRDYITAGAIASERMQWGNMHPALESIARAYRPGQASPSTRGGSGRSSSYRADAVVRYGDTLWLRRRWVAVSSSQHSALPWRVMRTEAPRVVAPRSG